MGAKWQGFVATDAIKNPALVPKYASNLHVAKAGRALRVCAGRLEGPPEDGYALGGRNVPELWQVSSRGRELDALVD